MAASGWLRRGTALLVIDMVSDFRFEDGARIAAAATPVARRIAALRARAKKARVPTVFVNDHWGNWKLGFRELVERFRKPSSRGAEIIEALAPAADDHFVLKPAHGGFYATSLEKLLESLRVRRLILTGVSAHQCILFTAIEAYIRGFELIVPRDCVAAKSPRQVKFALGYLRDVLHAEVGSSRE